MRSGAIGFRLRNEKTNPPTFFPHARYRARLGKKLVESRENVVVFSEKCRKLGRPSPPNPDRRNPLRVRTSEARGPRDAWCTGQPAPPSEEDDGQPGPRCTRAHEI